MAAIDSYTASNEINDYWQEGNSVEIKDVSLEDSSTLDQIREQVQKPLKDRVEIIESNKNFTVSIIDGTIRVKELSKEVKASKVSLWSHRVIRYAALIPLSLLLMFGVFPVASALPLAMEFKLTLIFANTFFQGILFPLSLINYSRAFHQKRAWQANLAEDIAQLRQYVFAGGKLLLSSFSHSEHPRHKKILISNVASKYPGFSSSLYYACLGKNGARRLLEQDNFFKPSEKDPLSLNLRRPIGLRY